nr:hypothetical protein [Neobacillus sp. Marseille-Q6967]
MGFFLGALVLIGIIAILTRVTFRNRRPCPKCGSVNPGSSGVCSSCGYVFPIGETDGLEDNNKDDEADSDGE